MAFTRIEQTHITLQDSISGFVSGVVVILDCGTGFFIDKHVGRWLFYGVFCFQGGRLALDMLFF